MCDRSATVVHVSQLPRAGLLLASLGLGCVSTVPQLYQNAALNATAFRLGILRRPAALEIPAPPAETGQTQAPPTYKEVPLEVTVTALEGQAPYILYWILEIEGAQRNEDKHSVFLEGTMISTGSSFVFPLAKLGQDDGITGPESAYKRNLKRNYTLKAIWDNDFNQTNLTTTTTITYQDQDGNRSRLLNPRDPKDAQVYLNGKLQELKETADDPDTVYPSAATRFLIAPSYRNVRFSPAVSFELTIGGAPEAEAD